MIVAIKALAALLGLSGVAVAAIASHAVKDPAAARSLLIAAGLALVHAVAAQVALATVPGRWGEIAGGLFVLGALLFAGAVCVRGFTGTSLGPVAPTGGVLMMLGWAALFFAALRSATL